MSLKFDVPSPEEDRQHRVPRHEKHYVGGLGGKGVWTSRGEREGSQEAPQEFLAMSFHNIANAGVHDPMQRLIDRVEELRGDTVEGFREAFKDTHITNKGDESIVLRLFENTLENNTGR